MVNWTGLHGDMFSLVAKYLTQAPDHLSFSMVCSSWRSAALDIRGSLPFSVPLLMLPGDTCPNLQTRSYLSLSDKRIYKRSSPFPNNDVCVGSNGGWLVIIHMNLDASLFNPFSGERLPLPPVTSIPKIKEDGMVLENDIFVDVAALSASDVSNSTNDLTVMISYGLDRRLAFAKSGDSSWQVIEDEQYCPYANILFYKEKFYAIGEHGTVECDIGPTPKVTLVAPGLPGYISQGMLVCYKWYLVESLGELLAVGRWIHIHCDYIDDDVDDDGSITADFGLVGKMRFPPEKLGDNKREFKTIFFTTYILDFNKKKWIQVKNLSNQIFFIGHNTSFSLSSLNYGKSEGNCIYFTEDYREGGISSRYKKKSHGYDMGIFYLSDGSIKPLFDADCSSYYPTPMWIVHRPW